MALLPYSVINPGLLVRNCPVALRFAEQAGPNHPSVATSLNNLALLYDSRGQYAQAEPFYKRSLAIREKALGPNHPDVTVTLKNMAMLYRKIDREEEAEALEKRAEEIGENKS